MTFLPTQEVTEHIEVLGLKGQPILKFFRMRVLKTWDKETHQSGGSHLTFFPTEVELVFPKVSTTPNTQVH
jgi:hypothetical protein